MTQIPLNPYSVNAVVETYVGTAYETVKLVAANLPVIQTLGTADAISAMQTLATPDSINAILTVGLDPFKSQIAAVSDNAADIATVASSADNITDVLSNLTAVNAVAANLPSVTGVYTDLTAINFVVGNFSVINNVANNVADISAVAANIGNVNYVANNIPTIVNDVDTNTLNIETLQTDDAAAAALVAGLQTQLGAILTRLANVEAVAIAQVSTLPSSPFLGSQAKYIVVTSTGKLYRFVNASIGYTEVSA